MARVHNGASPVAVAPGERIELRTQVRAELGLAGDRRLAVTVAALREQKGHRILVMAIPQILKAHPDLSFVWCGTGPLESELRRMVAAYGIQHAVHFAGRRLDVRRFLAAGDLFVFPTLFEGLPLALLEAMSAGLPVVSSDTGAIPEVLQDGVHGLLHRSGDPCDLMARMNWALDIPRRWRRWPAMPGSAPPIFRRTG